MRERSDLTHEHISKRISKIKSIGAFNIFLTTARLTEWAEAICNSRVDFTGEQKASLLKIYRQEFRRSDTRFQDQAVAEFKW